MTLPKGSPPVDMPRSVKEIIRLAPGPVTRGIIKGIPSRAVTRRTITFICAVGIFVRLRQRRIIDIAGIRLGRNDLPVAGGKRGSNENEVYFLRSLHI